MATTLRNRKAKDFDIHEDGPYTEDTEMDTDAVGDEAEPEVQDDNEGYARHGRKHDHRTPSEQQEEEQDPEAEEDDEAEAEADMSDEEVLDDDMRKLQNAFPGFKHKYRLIKRIGEGESALSLFSFPALPLLLVPMPVPVLITSPRRHIFYRLQSPGPAVRAVRQQVGSRQGEREVDTTAK